MENRLYVGNLAFQSSEEGLRDAFGAHGTVTSVTLVTDRDTGRPRGFAFIAMETQEGAEKAISALNATEMDGRTIQVSVAKPRESRTGGGGGGGSRSRY